MAQVWPPRESNPKPNERLPVTEAVAAYNEAAEQVGWPKCLELNQKRQRSLRACLRDEGLGPWRAMLLRARDSPFLTGQTKRSAGHEGWRPTIDFFLRPEVRLKVHEGSYDDAGRGSS